MKKLLVTILLSLPLASLADMMVIPNQQGGHIALFKDACPVDHDKSNPLYLAVATTTNSDVIPGCWMYKDQKVFVVWFTDNGVVESDYPAENFEYVASDKKYL